jgi:hypothetical protein
MPTLVNDILGMIGLGVFGFGVARFLLDAYHKANWQLQIAIVLGLFGLLIGLADFSTSGLVGAFALGAGVVFLMSTMAKKDGDVKKDGEVKKVAEAKKDVDPDATLVYTSKK